jgi:hypothetical protein
MKGDVKEKHSLPDRQAGGFGLVIQPLPVSAPRLVGLRLRFGASK